ncbi:MULTISPECIES: FAD-dependent oxidoreductase [Bacteroides]|jgi:pyruvate/2-oxoglutarate dehydrogenase complex dihydrolipoamide dehydrogenase (E3) component|uniref:FAD-dependent oxidoreductase n=1 Tax=Bacteroides TaxID=816 RepID=UPI000E443F96|nr:MULTISPECIES: FAD-dependent oxidoreductase [Bacteroides]MBS7574367.1 FAD-dependent oxidoreductase [Bacteroides propionicigenes]RGM26918.1 pyridine nucleotide-disulfide oxidoreductase [Bacteroides sp. OM08-17BH]HBO06032.1 pyridine nucleotide-disulfide oxidoreductase [Bacteroides sp.]
MKKYDAIIIGFGKGGKTLAAELAKRNFTVAMIERSDKMYGGTCINIGCIPTKTLVHSAELADKNASWEQKQAYYRQSVARKEEVTSFLRQKNYHNLADNPNITVYTGTGSFIAPDAVEVRMAEETIQLQAPQIFVNTGAETVIPPIEGVRDNPKVYTSTSIMELEELPKHLVIVGGGYIGLEFASMYASFGSQVTVLESYAELIAREDRDIAASVQEVLEKKGVAFRLNARVQSVDGTVVVYQDAVTGEVLRLDADAILLATGRRPNTAGLNLAAAGVEVDERGAIIVNEHLQTTNPNIRAIGDVKGGLQFTYISLDDYRILREDLFGAGERKVSDREPVGYSVFIDPPLSRIGMSEVEARKRGLNIKVNKLPVAAIPRARTLGNTNGLFKVIVDADTDKIVGCTLFGPESSEVINLVAMAMKTGQEYTFLRDFIFTHPSMSEALNDLMNL